MILSARPPRYLAGMGSERCRLSVTATSSKALSRFVISCWRSVWCNSQSLVDATSSVSTRRELDGKKGGFLLGILTRVAGLEIHELGPFADLLAHGKTKRRYLPRTRCEDRVLHFHRLQNQERGAFGELDAGLGQDCHHLSGHRRQ